MDTDHQAEASKTKFKKCLLKLAGEVKAGTFTIGDGNREELLYYLRLAAWARLIAAPGLILFAQLRRHNWPWEAAFRIWLKIPEDPNEEPPKENPHSWKNAMKDRKSNPQNHPTPS